jgi:hypothetical protein
MKKKNFGLIIAFLLPLMMSTFLFFNYISIKDGQERISSETGYYLFLGTVVIASILFSISQHLPISKGSIIISAFKISLLLLVCVGLDMFLHMLARGLTHPQNIDPVLSAGIPISLSLLKSTWQIYGVRFISVLVIGNLLFFGITRRR